MSKPQGNKLQSDTFHEISIPAIEKSSTGRAINTTRHGLNEYITHFLHVLSISDL